MTSPARPIGPRVIDRILDRHGRLDVLVNNAGIWITGRVTDTPLADYRRVIEVNQVGTFLGMQAASKPMMAARKGSIINISSIAGLRNSGSGFAYGASKWAVRGMTKTAARELGPYNVRVNSIHPGLIETAMLHQLPGIDSGQFDAYPRRHPPRPRRRSQRSRQPRPLPGLRRKQLLHRLRIRRRRRHDRLGDP